MRRLLLALVCFFRILFGRRLPPQVLVEGATAPSGAGPDVASQRLAGPRRTGRLPSAGEGGGAIALLALLQREGRFVDFLRESISDYSDERVGAAVRAVHRGCRKVLEEYVSLGPVLDRREGETVIVEADFDPAEIRLTGAVHGSPPFRGRLRHPGWRVLRLDLPPEASGIVAPAEVEL